MKLDFVNPFDASGEEYAVPARKEHGTKKALPGADEFSEARTGRAVSASLLQSYDTCSQKGVYHRGGEQTISPTKFTSDFMLSGVVFEAHAVKRLHSWVGRIEEAMGIECPVAAHTDLRYDDLTPHKRREVAYAAIRACQRGTPAVFFGVPLFLSADDSKLVIQEGAVPFEGEIDLLLWTGTYWVIGDIKCSETGRASYANQVTLYARAFRAIFPELPLYEYGFIAHCAPGFLFALKSSADSRERALAAIVVERVSFRNFENGLDVLIDKFWHDDGIPAFSQHCIECGYRHKCYSNMIVDNDKTPISLFPVSKDEARALREGEHGGACYLTVEDLLEDFKAGVIPPALRGIVTETSLPYFIGRAEATIAWRGYSAMRLPASLADGFITGAWEPPDDDDEKNKFFVTAVIRGRKITVPIEEATEEWRRSIFLSDGPDFLLTYDARAQLFAALKLAELWPDVDEADGLTTKRFPRNHGDLLGLIREFTHIPFTSLTLAEIYHFLREAHQSNFKDALLMWAKRIQPSEDSKSWTVTMPSTTLTHSEMLADCVGFLQIINSRMHEMEVRHA